MPKQFSRIIRQQQANLDGTPNSPPSKEAVESSTSDKVQHRLTQEKESSVQPFSHKSLSDEFIGAQASEDDQSASTATEGENDSPSRPIIDMDNSSGNSAPSSLKRKTGDDAALNAIQADYFVEFDDDDDDEELLHENLSDEDHSPLMSPQPDHQSSAADFTLSPSAQEVKDPCSHNAAHVRRHSISSVAPFQQQQSQFSRRTEQQTLLADRPTAVMTMTHTPVNPTTLTSPTRHQQHVNHDTGPKAGMKRVASMSSVMDSSKVTPSVDQLRREFDSLKQRWVEIDSESRSRERRHSLSVDRASSRAEHLKQHRRVVSASTKHRTAAAIQSHKRTNSVGTQQQPLQHAQSVSPTGSTSRFRRLRGQLATANSPNKQSLHQRSMSSNDVFRSSAEQGGATRHRRVSSSSKPPAANSAEERSSMSVPTARSPRKVGSPRRPSRIKKKTHFPPSPTDGSEDDSLDRFSPAPPATEIDDTAVAEFESTPTKSRRRLSPSTSALLKMKMEAVRGKASAEDLSKRQSFPRRASLSSSPQKAQNRRVLLSSRQQQQSLRTNSMSSVLAAASAPRQAPQPFHPVQPRAEREERPVRATSLERSDTVERRRASIAGTTPSARGGSSSSSMEVHRARKLSEPPPKTSRSRILSTSSILPNNQSYSVIAAQRVAAVAMVKQRRASMSTDRVTSSRHRKSFSSEQVSSSPSSQSQSLPTASHHRRTRSSIHERTSKKQPLLPTSQSSPAGSRVIRRVSSGERHSASMPRPSSDSKDEESALDALALCTDIDDEELDNSRRRGTNSSLFCRDEAITSSLMAQPQSLTTIDHLITTHGAATPKHRQQTSSADIPPPPPLDVTDSVDNEAAMLEDCLRRASRTSPLQRGEEAAIRRTSSGTSSGTPSAVGKKSPTLVQWFNEKARPG